MNTGEELFEMEEEEMLHALNSAMQEALKTYFEQNGPIVIPEEGGDTRRTLNHLEPSRQGVTRCSRAIPNR